MHRHDRYTVLDSQQPDAGFEAADVAGLAPCTFREKHDGLALPEQPRTAPDSCCVCPAAPHRPCVVGVNKPGEPTRGCKQLLLGQKVNLAARAEAYQQWVEVRDVVGREYLRPG